MAHQIELNTNTLQAVLEQVNNLPDAGTDLPELSNPATAADALSGKEFIDGSGNKVTGSIATKTASNLTASGATVTVPAGYYASQATKSVATATQATPSVSIDSAGKITASATQTAGYVTAGTKTGTKQLTVQAAQTITPGTTNKTIASGRYLTGTQTIKGDANLVAGNIKSGVSIFGVAGTVSEGEDVSAETAEYTAQLDELESTIDSLPDAGSSGGGSVEMCSVQIKYPTIYEIHDVLYTTIDDQGNIKAVTEQKEVFDAVINTLVFIKHAATYSSDKAELVVNSHLGCLFKLTAQAGETVSIETLGSGGGGT